MPNANMGSIHSYRPNDQKNTEINKIQKKLKMTFLKP